MAVSTILRISNPIVLNTESLIKKANPTLLRAMGLPREKIALYKKQLDAYSMRVFFRKLSRLKPCNMLATCTIDVLPKSGTISHLNKFSRTKLKIFLTSKFLEPVYTFQNTPGTNLIPNPLNVYFLAGTVPPRAKNATH